MVGDGAPGLVRAIGELWPGADRQRCAVHRLRNILAKLPKNQALHDRIRAAYWSALDEADSPEQAGLRTLVGDLERDLPVGGGLPGRRSARADGPPALPAPPAHALAKQQPAGTVAGRGQAAHRGDGQLPGRDELPVVVLGGQTRPAMRRVATRVVMEQSAVGVLARCIGHRRKLALGLSCAADEDEAGLCRHTTPGGIEGI
ncbi:MAG: transposase [Candidatus Limnocylindria bacterium]